MGEWLNKWWYIYTIECYSTIKKNELLIHATTCITLQRIMLNEKKLVSKRLHTILFHSTLLKWQNYSNEEQISVCPGLRMGRDGKEMGIAIIEHEGFFLWWKCCVFWLCWCQYLGYTIVFQDVTVTIRKTIKGTQNLLFCLWIISK